jgi:cytochrome c oxidase subunit 2
MRNRPLLQMILFAAVSTAILLAVVLSINWFPAHASEQINRTSTLYDVLLIASVPMFVIVETVVIFSVWKYRMRPGQETLDGPPLHGNTRLEVLWTVLPAILIFGLAIYGYTVLHANETKQAREMIVNVTARQFAFEFSYPHEEGKTVVSPILYLPKDRPVVFKLRSYDVVHSFFVPEFAEKLDAVPGITTTLRVTATRVGSYPVECTELCGAGHGLMRAGVRVVSQAQFDSWLRAQKPGANPPIGRPSPDESQAGVPGSSGSGASQGSSP